MFFEEEKYKQIETITEKVVYYSILLYGIFFFFVPMFLMPETPQLEHELANPIIWCGLGGALIIQSRNIAKEFDFETNYTTLYTRVFDIVSLCLGFVASVYGFNLLQKLVTIPQTELIQIFIELFSYIPYVGIFLIMYRCIVAFAVIKRDGEYAGE